MKRKKKRRCGAKCRNLALCPNTKVCCFVDEVFLVTGHFALVPFANVDRFAYETKRALSMYIPSFLSYNK